MALPLREAQANAEDRDAALRREMDQQEATDKRAEAEAVAECCDAPDRSTREDDGSSAQASGRD